MDHLDNIEGSTGAVLCFAALDRAYLIIILFFALLVAFCMPTFLLKILGQNLRGILDESWHIALNLTLP